MHVYFRLSVLCVYFTDLSLISFADRMSIKKYFKPREGLPDPRGSISASISTRAIHLANLEVEKAVNAEKVKWCGPYNKDTILEFTHSHKLSK